MTRNRFWYLTCALLLAFGAGSLRAQESRTSVPQSVDKPKDCCEKLMTCGIQCCEVVCPRMMKCAATCAAAFGCCARCCPALQGPATVDAGIVIRFPFPYSLTNQMKKECPIQASGSPPASKCPKCTTAEGCCASGTCCASGECSASKGKKASVMAASSKCPRCSKNSISGCSGKGCCARTATARRKKKKATPLVVVVPFGLPPFDHGPYDFGFMPPPPSQEAYMPPPAPFHAGMPRFSPEPYYQPYPLPNPVVMPAAAELLPPPTVCDPSHPTICPVDTRFTTVSEARTAATPCLAQPCPTQSCPMPMRDGALRERERTVAERPSRERGSENAYVVDVIVQEAKTGEKPHGVPFSEVRYSSHLTTTSTGSSHVSVAMVEGVMAVVHLGSSVTLHEGNVKDLVTHASYIAPEDNKVQLGQKVQIKVVRADNGLVRMDLTLDRNEIEMASKDGIVVLGNSMRTVQKLKLGKVKIIVLNKDADGTASTWIEVKVRELPKR